MAVTNISKLSGGAGELDGLVLTPVRNEILQSAYPHHLVRRLADFELDREGGMTKGMPYSNTVAFTQVAEAVAATYTAFDVDKDTVTFTKKVLKYPVSNESVAYGAGAVDQQIKVEAGIAYAGYLNAQAADVVNAITANDVGLGGAACTADAFAEARAKLIGSPGQIVCQIHPEHYSQLIGAKSLSEIAGNAWNEAIMAGPRALYVGTLAGIDMYLDATANGTGATAKSAIYARAGLTLKIKQTALPAWIYANGELALGIPWEDEFAAHVVSAIFFSGMVVRRGGAWVSNIVTGV